MLRSLAVKVTLPSELLALLVALLMVTPWNVGSSMVVPVLFHLMMNGVPAGMIAGQR